MSYLFAAYAVTWILLFLYMRSMAGKQTKLDAEIETLQQLIEPKK